LIILVDIFGENAEAEGGVSVDTTTSDEAFAAKIADKRTNLEF